MMRPMSGSAAGAPGGRCTVPFSLGALEGVKATPKRLTLGLVLGGVVGQTQAVAHPAPDFS